MSFHEGGVGYLTEDSYPHALEVPKEAERYGLHLLPGELFIEDLLELDEKIEETRRIEWQQQ